MESAVHGDEPESVLRYFERFRERLRFFRFFWSAPLLLAVVLSLSWRGGRKPLWPLGALLVFILGSNFYPYFYPHYIAAAACLFVLSAIASLERLPRPLACGILLTCAAQFGCWYTLHLLGKSSGYEAWDYINAGDPQGRMAVQEVLDHARGKQIVFVHLSPVHRFQEWVHNAANLERSKVIWLHDLGRDRNAQVLNHYRGRAPWLVKPDESPPVLERYVTSSSPFEDIP